MGKQSSGPQLRLATPNEGTTTHHAAPLEGRLSDAAAKAVNKLLPSGAAGNLSSLCSWADKVRFRYYWSAPLHFIDVPDNGTARTRRASRAAASPVPSTTTPPSSSPRDHHRHRHLLNLPANVMFRSALVPVKLHGRHPQATACGVLRKRREHHQRPLVQKEICTPPRKNG